MKTKISGKTHHAPHILVLDDDPILRKALGQLGKKHNLHMTLCSSVQELQQLGATEPFDVAVIDYYLEGYLGTDVAAVLGSTPVVMISAKAKRCIEESEEWPLSIRKFVDKEDGLEEILQTALTVGHAEEN